jgi:5-methylthioadenosine/S-adenosylhomocysteine deaminase
VEENVLIIADGLVLTCDPDNRAGSLTLVVLSGKIIEIGEDAAAIRARYPGAAVMNASGMLVIPGFVNAHVHSASYVLRDITAGVPLSGWNASAQLRDAMSRLESPAMSTDVMTIVRAATAAHVKSGTTAVAEMTAQLDADVYRRVVNAMGESGLRSLSVVRTWDQMAAARELAAEGHVFAMDLGAEEDFTVYSLESRIHAAREAGMPLVAHVGEMREHVEMVRRNFQKSLFHVLRDFGALHTDTLCAHMNHCTEPDAQALRDAGCTLTICIGSAMAKQTGYPFLRSLMAHDVRLAVGTDWGAFDVLAEARLLAQLPAWIPGIPEFTAVELLRMATINGAETLGIGSETGSIEPGKRADLVLMKLDDIRVPAVPSPVSAESLAALLMRSPQPPAVSDVLVEGVFEVHNGGLVRQDEQALLSDLHRLRERWGIRAAAPVSASGSDEPRASVLARSKVLQLVPREPDLPHEAVPAPSQTSSGQPQERTANLSAPKRRVSPKRPAIHPELPKDVRRVFGEDDEA